MAEFCSDGRYVVYRAYWENQDQYQPISSKFVGLGWDTTDHFKTGLSQRGMIGPLVGVGSIDALMAQPNAFSPANIIVSLDPIGWADDVNTAISKGVTQFYIDEPIHRSREGMVMEAAPYIAARGGILSLSEAEFDWFKLQTGWGALADMAFLAEQAQPHPYVGCHTHFDHQLGGTVDPRDQWTYLKGRLPSLFNFTSIKTRQTVDEMGLLFGHANNIGINKIFLYAYGPPPTYEYVGRVEYAADQAWRQGWLTRLQKERQDKWCCPTQELDISVCDFQSFIYTGNERWI